MKDLVLYIKEELDDNIFWKIEQWFKRKPAEYKQFINLVDKCRENNTVDKDFIESELEKLNIKISKFIDFLDDDIYGDNEAKDYVYQMKKVIELIIGRKDITLEAK